MVNCDYCNKEVNRKVFCSSSHKVLYHRKHKRKEENKGREVQVPEEEVEKDVLWEESHKSEGTNPFGFCKIHGGFNNTCGGPH